MKQWITTQDGFDQLKLVDAPMPDESALKAGEVLVKINRVSLNYRDTEVIMGLYGHHDSMKGKPKEPLVPCSDISGTVVKTGPASSPSSPLQEGDRVMATFNQTHVSGQIQEADMGSGLGLPQAGCLTEYRVFPATGLVRVPDYMSDEEASCLPIAAVTAWMSINSFRPVGQPLTATSSGAGEAPYVLLQGTGGVSISGLQIAYALGLRTIVTSSSDAKLERARALGADYLINYRAEPEWQARVLEITGGRGADVIFETGGAQTLEKSFECVAFGGLISCIGYLSGKEDAPGKRMNANLLALKRNVTLKGILNGPKERFEEMLGLYREKEIRPVVDRLFEFAQAKEALEYLFAGQHFGKVVIKVS